MGDDYYRFQLARFDAMKRRIDAGNELAREQIARSERLRRLSLRLLGKPDTDLQDRKNSKAQLAACLI